MLQEKIDDYEKEKKDFEEKLTKEKQAVEKKLKSGYQKIVESKSLQIDKL